MSIQVLTYNIWGWGRDLPSSHFDRLGGFIADSGADLVFLAEVKAGAGQTERLARAGGYPFWIEIPSYPHHHSALALGLLARLPVETAEAFPIYRTPDGWHMALRACLRPPGSPRPWTFYGVHLWNMDQITMSVWRMARAEMLEHNPRLHQIRHLLLDIASRKEPVVVAGDFNTFPFSAAYRAMGKRFRDACPLHLTFRGTYRHRGLRPRLDYIWLLPNLAASEYAVCDPGLSDHAAVTVRLNDTAQ